MERILSFIGIAQKAGKVKTGEYLTMKALKEFEACLVIIAEDTSEKATERDNSIKKPFDVALNALLKVFEEVDG